MEQCTVWYEPDQSRLSARVEEYCCTCRATIWSHYRYSQCRSEAESVHSSCYPPHHRSRCQMSSQQLRPGLRWHWHWLLITTLLVVCAQTEPSNTWRAHHKSSGTRRIDSASHSVRRLPVQHHNYSSVLMSTNYGRTGRHTPPYNPSPYYNSQLMSIPFPTQHQLIFQHQMLSQLVPPAVPPLLSGAPAPANTNTPQHSNQIPRNMPRMDSNDLSSSASSPNMLKVKGSKWWDIGREPSEAMVEHMDGRHANAILPNKPTSSVLSTMNLPLRKKQRRLVRDNPGVLSAISNAMRLAISECQNQFRDRRWNCPVNDWKKGKNVFGRIIQRGCRETAFVYALTSAAVAHSIARACTEGQIETCTCDYRNNRKAGGIDWEWGGCSDNIEFGYKFSRAFVDAAERGRDLRFVMNLHNNEAGRLHVQNEMRRECKCHGMSGSCTVKTCWMQLPSFRHIGNNLKDRFDGASRVLISNDYRGITRKMFKKVQLKPYETGYKTPTHKDLIYFEESPDFCTSNPKYGVMGTQGRICNASSIGVEGCNLLCCGRGHVTEEIEEFERCNCTFKWCCDVRCKICKNKRQISRCL